jgi:hypothetical protein
MKTKGIGKKLRSVIDGGDKKKGALKKVLKKLKKRDLALNGKLKGTKDDKTKKELHAKIKINRAHRKKGLKALSGLKGK